jgi:myb proto-oncogene protein
LDPINALTGGREGNWTADEDSKLKDAFRVTGGKNWNAIAALVPDRTKTQCYSRWHRAWDPHVDRTPIQRTGNWTTEEDIKLKNAVQVHDGMNWPAIAALVQDRTKDQCLHKWSLLLDPCFDKTSRCTKWTSDEDEKLKAAVQMHGRKDWNVITALVPGRTKSQCGNRWREHLDPSRS